MKACCLCKQGRQTELLRFGDQPVCHRFVGDNAPEETYPLTLGQCPTCGLIQLTDPFPVDALVPQYAWVRYNEPDAHLKAVAERIAALPGISTESRVLGVGPYDAPLLEYLRACQFRHTAMLDPVRDLGLKETKPTVHDVQNRLNRELAAKIANQRGFYDVVIARRILEHAYNFVDFLHALRSLALPGGYVVIEVPDCQLALEKTDVGVIWEEHILYFTPATFQESLTFGGFTLVSFDNVAYPQENSLVAIAQSDGASPAFLKESSLQTENERATTFAVNLVQLRESLLRYCTEYRSRGNRIALLGAGHRSCMYINLMELKEFLEFVVDDDPNKQHLRMPGSHLPIRGSKALLEYGIKLCLLGINPTSENNVIQSNQDFLKSGGSFSSISPDSKYALQT